MECNIFTILSALLLLLYVYTNVACHVNDFDCYFNLPIFQEEHINKKQFTV